MNGSKNGLPCLADSWKKKLNLLISSGSLVTPPSKPQRRNIMKQKKQKDTKKEELSFTPKTISGIDTLYYFYESNEKYDDMFLDILNQINETKEKFEKKYLKYENSDITLSLNNQLFIYNGKAQGFYWLTHSENYFKIAFKDNMTNRGLNDIQVQLSAVGIYTLGLKTLINYVDTIIAPYTTGYKPLTRVDLNIFVEDDLSWIDKSMFVSRKRSYTSIFKEVANKHRMETLYIGKKPFLLRIYDKLAELKKSKKQELMYHHFKVNGFTSMEYVTNIEFELHRDYFKAFQIYTVDDLLLRAELLFQNCLGAIRLVNLSTITDNTLNAKNKNRAQTHPLWQHLNDSYKLQGFLSQEAPLQRIKRKNYAYTIEKALEEHITLARKFYIHGGVIDEAFYKEVLHKFKTTKEFDYSVTPPSEHQKDSIILDSQGYELIYENIESEALNDDEYPF